MGKRLNLYIQLLLIGVYLISKAVFYIQTLSVSDFIEFFDVGQGDAALINSAGAKILIDGGPDYDVSYKLQKYMFFNSCSLDVIVLTHPHADHVAGLNRVLEHCRVSKVVYSYFEPKTSLDYRFLALVEHKAVLIPDINTRLYIDNASLTFVWPPKGYLDKNVNNQSLVAVFEENNFEALFLGDAELPALNQIPFSTYLSNADVLKVSHHGSSTGTDEKLLSKFNIGVAIISVAKKNVYNLPSKKVTDLFERKNINVYRTDVLGSIVVKIDKL